MRPPHYNLTLQSRPGLFVRRLLSHESHESTGSQRWQELRSLGNASVQDFQQQCFLPEEPAIIRRAFLDIPAATKWFTNDGPASTLQLEYLRPYQDAIMPMELTRGTGGKVNFDRADAMFAMFLRWRKAIASDQSRLYIAQAPLNGLPGGLQQDLPTPELVSKAGQGDIYDASLWMGDSPTYTPLHKDPNPNLFIQLAGFKTVRLLPPDAGHGVFKSVQQALRKHASASFRGNEMMQGEERRLLERQIWDDTDTADWSDASSGFEAQLKAGDGVFIPKRWWHSVKGTGKGITASVCATWGIF